MQQSQGKPGGQGQQRFVMRAPGPQPGQMSGVASGQPQGQHMLQQQLQQNVPMQQQGQPGQQMGMNQQLLQQQVNLPFLLSHKNFKLTHVRALQLQNPSGQVNQQGPGGVSSTIGVATSASSLSSVVAGAGQQGGLPIPQALQQLLVTLRAQNTPAQQQQVRLRYSFVLNISHANAHISRRYFRCYTFSSKIHSCCPRSSSNERYSSSKARNSKRNSKVLLPAAVRKGSPCSRASRACSRYVDRSLCAQNG